MSYTDENVREEIEVIKNEIILVMRMISEKEKEKMAMFEEECNYDSVVSDLHIFQQKCNEVFTEKEHIDIISEKTNKVRLLNDHNKNLSQEISVLLGEICSLSDSNNDMEVSIFENQITNDVSNNSELSMKQYTDFLCQTLKDQETIKLSILSQSKRSENALTTQIQRKNNLDDKGDGIIDTNNSIANLRNEINAISSNIDTGIGDMCETEDYMREQMNDYELHKEHSLKVYGFQEVSREISSEIQRINETIVKNKSVLMNIEISVRKNEKKLKLLNQCLKYYKKSEMVTMLDAEELYPKVKLLIQSKEQEGIQKHETLSKVMKKNNEMQSLILALKRHLSLSIGCIKNKQQLSLSNIDHIYEENATEEKYIVDRINQKKTCLTPKNQGKKR